MILLFSLETNRLNAESFTFSKVKSLNGARVSINPGIYYQLDSGMPSHSSILCLKILRTEEPGQVTVHWSQRELDMTEVT